MNLAKKLKNIEKVTNGAIHRMFFEFGSSLGTRRSLSAWLALDRRRGRIIIIMRTIPTNHGPPVNVNSKAMSMSKRARKKFVRTSWVEIVLAGEGVFVFGEDRTILRVCKKVELLEVQNFV